MQKQLFAVAFVAIRDERNMHRNTTHTEYGVEFWAAVSKEEAQGFMMEKLKKTKFPASLGFTNWDCGAVPVPEWQPEDTASKAE